MWSMHVHVHTAGRGAAKLVCNLRQGLVEDGNRAQEVSALPRGEEKEKEEKEEVSGRTRTD